MRITIEVPDTTKALIITGLLEELRGTTLAAHMVDSSEIGDGAEIICDWEKEHDSNRD